MNLTPGGDGTPSGGTPRSTAKPIPHVKSDKLIRKSGHTRNPSQGGNNADMTTSFRGWKALNFESSSVRKVRSTSDFGFVESDEWAKISIGVCAMGKKTHGKPMLQILKRLEKFGDFEIVIFEDETILNQPVEEWPVVEALIAFHSDGFPLKKAKDYVDLRRPYLLNDVDWQFVLLDRRLVYRRLREVGIPVPKHIIVNREEPDFADPPGFVETEDYVELHGERIEKPFVEKPASGEDHNIYIYYPHSMGGGVKKLFRKVENKSADYDAKHPGTVRRDGSYIYEQFITTGGTDVKVYTIGPRYAHAEARKSPVVDGKVVRSADGKEIRFPVLLSPQEKEMARIVCLAFGQKVCGFDMLRTDRGRSYVCDVNGWSFVKNSTKYYDDCSAILRGIILGALAPTRLHVLQVPGKMRDRLSHLGPEELEEMGSPRGPSGGMASSLESQDGEEEDGDSMDELRCVLAVIRHGDRTPKQKVKVKISQRPMLDLLVRHMDSKGKQAKLKSPNQMQELLDITRDLIKELTAQQAASRDIAAFGAAHPGAGGTTPGTPPTPLQSQGSITVSDSGAGPGPKLEVPSGPQSPRGAAGAAAAGSDAGATAGSAAPAPSPGGAQAASPLSAAAAAAATAAYNSGAASSPKPQGPTTNQNLGSSSPDLHAMHTPVPAPAPDETQDLIEKLKIIRAVLEQGGHFSGINRKAQLKPLRWSDGAAAVPLEAMLIVKHGGVLTHAGREQAERLGSQFRTVMYPTHGNPENGFLRLHSTYRHDLKMYSSDEGRVQTSAAAFLKGLLDLEGASLTPILVSLVKKDASMLDVFDKGASRDIRMAKAVLYHAMTYDEVTNQTYSVPLPAVNEGSPKSLSPPGSPRPAGAAGGAAPHKVKSVASLRVESEGNLLQGGPTSPMFTRGTLSPMPRATSEVSTAEGFRPEGSARPDRNPTPPQTPGGGLGVEKTLSGGISLDIPPGSELPTPTPTPGLPPLAPGGSRSRAILQTMPSGFRDSSVASFTSMTGGMGADGSTMDLPSRPPRTPSRNASSNNMAHAAKELQDLSISAADIPRLPDKPLETLFKLRDLLVVLVDSMRQLCLTEDRSEEIRAYSALTQDPRSEWGVQGGHPCGGERLILMYDRWRKLQKAFYNEKKRQFDISKIPDIYDSAKYDSIHNLHLGKEEKLPGQLYEVYEIARVLAACVVPSEYGISDGQKVRIGGKIAKELLGKLLLDLDRVRQESIELASQEGTASGVEEESNLYLTALAARYDEEAIEPPPSFGGMSPLVGKGPQAVNPSGPEGDSKSGEEKEGSVSGGEVGRGGEVAGGENEDFLESDTVHRLCPTYASDIRTPLRHVRTRIYFTSESHIHSLLSVLRFAHLGRELPDNCRMVLEEAERIIRNETPELDYLSHIVFRMYENKRVPIGDPARFRIEVMFSPGASFSPYDICTAGGDHTMPVASRLFLTGGQGLNLADVELLLSRYASRKPFANFLSTITKPKVMRFKKVVLAVLCVVRLRRLLPVLQASRQQGRGPPGARQAAGAAGAAATGPASLPRWDAEGIRAAAVAAERLRVSQLPNFY